MQGPSKRTTVSVDPMASFGTVEHWEEETLDDESYENSSKTKIDLDLSYLGLSSLDPRSLLLHRKFEIERLRRLILVGNVLNILPSNISNFINLEELDVSSNGLTWISGEVARLQSLHTLIVKNNRLRNLPKEFNTCPAIKVLNLSGNLYDDIPRQLLQMPKLRELYIGGNRVAEVPEGIHQMQGYVSQYHGPRIFSQDNS